MTGIITKIVKIIGSETEPETINAHVNINMQSGGHPYKEVELAVQQAQCEFIRRLVKPRLHITTNKAWVLESIRITALSERASELVRLTQQDLELDDQDLLTWIKEKCTSYHDFFKTEYLEQVIIQPDSKPDLQTEGDAYDKALKSGSAATPDWDVKLIGNW